MNLVSSLNLASETPLQREENRKIKTIMTLLSQHPDSSEFKEPVDWQGLQLSDYTTLIKNPMDLGTISEKLKGEEYRFVEEILDDVQLIWDNCKSYNQSGSWIYVIADKVEKYFRKLIKNYFNSIPITLATRSGLDKEKIDKGEKEREKDVIEKVKEKEKERADKVEKVEKFEENAAIKVVRQSNRRVERMDSRTEREGRDFEDRVEAPRDEKREILLQIKRLTPERLGEVVQLILDLSPAAVSINEDEYQIIIPNIQAPLWQEIKEKLTELDDHDEKPSKKVKI